MQAISIVQGYFQVHGGSSKLFGALTEAENILVKKKLLKTLLNLE